MLDIRCIGVSSYALFAKYKRNWTKLNIDLNSGTTTLTLQGYLHSQLAQAIFLHSRQWADTQNSLCNSSNTSVFWSSQKYCFGLDLLPSHKVETGNYESLLEFTQLHLQGKLVQLLLRDAQNILGVTVPRWQHRAPGETSQRRDPPPESPSAQGSGYRLLTRVKRKMSSRYKTRKLQNI